MYSYVLLMMGGEPPETCRMSVKINKLKKRCILLAVIWNYNTMHGHTNIKRINLLLHIFWDIPPQRWGIMWINMYAYSTY